jgi:hypothetical protein
MSSSTIRGRASGIRLAIRDIIYNGGVINKCVLSNNVRVRE